MSSGIDYAHEQREAERRASNQYAENKERCEQWNELMDYIEHRSANWTVDDIRFLTRAKKRLIYEYHNCAPKDLETLTGIYQRINV